MGSSCRWADGGGVEVEGCAQCDETGLAHEARRQPLEPFAPQHYGNANGNKEHARPWQEAARIGSP